MLLTGLPLFGVEFLYKWRPSSVTSLPNFSNVETVFRCLLRTVLYLQPTVFSISSLFTLPCIQDSCQIRTHPRSWELVSLFWSVRINCLCNFLSNSGLMNLSLSCLYDLLFSISPLFLSFIRTAYLTGMYLISLFLLFVLWENSRLALLKHLQT